MPKRTVKLTRARVSGQVDNGKVEKLQDLLAPLLPAAVQAWIDGLKANLIAYDRTAHKMVDTGFPDNKIRADCAQRIIEYVVGKAIERSMEITGNYKELTQVLEELKASPEARRLLPPELWGMIEPPLQSNVKGKDAAHEGSTISQSEQKTG
jgi:hypothetical protein